MAGAPPRLGVLGAGAWGTGLAQHAARHGAAVWLWGRDPAALDTIERERVNTRYLPGVPLDDRIHTEADLGRLLAHLRGDGSDEEGALLLLATSLGGLRPTLAALAAAAADRPQAGPLPPLVWLCKGIEGAGGRLPHEIVGEVLGAAGLSAEAWPGGPLFGPSFAQEVAAGLPVALTLAAADPRLIRATRAMLHHGPVRIYDSDDVVGVELGGALKNVIAIATGICDGLRLGLNARAALITRGLAEIARLGVAHGARAETFQGLTGLGDLVLTCTGDLSRNRRVGLELAAGHSLADTLARLGHVAEGVATVAAARDLATRLGVEVPIVQAVDDVVAGRLAAADAVRALLAREPRRESD